MRDRTPGPSPVIRQLGQDPPLSMYLGSILSNHLTTPVMKFTELLAEAGIKDAAQLKSNLCQCKNRNYITKDGEETDTAIQYVTLPKPVEGFSVCFLSYNATLGLADKTQSISTLDAAFDEEYGWRAQLPANHIASELKFTW